MQISQFFMSGDIKGAIAYMREHEEFKDVLPAYTAIFEDCKYRTYDVPDILNEILRLYQITTVTCSTAEYRKLTLRTNCWHSSNLSWKCLTRTKSISPSG